MWGRFFIFSGDVDAAFDNATPGHVEKALLELHFHPGFIAALLAELTELSCEASAQESESGTFRFFQMYSTGRAWGYFFLDRPYSQFIS